MMLATAAGGVVIFAVSQSLVNTNESVKKIKLGLEFMEFVADLARSLKDDPFCDQTFAGASLSGTTVGTVSNVVGSMGGTPLQNLVTISNNSGNILNLSQVNVRQLTAGANQAQFDVQVVMTHSLDQVPKRAQVGRVTLNFSGTTVDSPNACSGSLAGTVGIIPGNTASWNLGNDWRAVVFIGGATQGDNGMCGGVVVNDGTDMRANLVSLASGGNTLDNAVLSPVNSCTPAGANSLCARRVAGNLVMQTGSNCGVTFRKMR